MHKKPGLLVILSSPTGGGKDTVIGELLKLFPGSVRLVTTTSRLPRPTDREGVTYHFVSRPDFEQKIQAGYFLEYNNFAGNYYGTPRQSLTDLLTEHELVLSNLDVHGKYNIDRAGIEHLSIFLLPENMDILKNRARKRGGITEAMISDRIKIAAEEIKRSAGYDYQITNHEGKLAQTVNQIADIIRERLKDRAAKGPVDKTKQNS